MEWVRSHPYASALSAAGLLIVAGIFVVVIKSPTAPVVSQAGTWGGAGAVLNPPYAPAADAQQNVGIMQQVQGGAPYTYILPTPQTEQPDTATSTGFDFDAFIALLSKPPANTGAGTVDLSSAYAYIPSGLVRANEAPKRSKLQDALFTYGNEVGSLIQSFEQAHPNASQVLMDQAQDRADAGKASAVQSLGRALSALGDSMLAMDAVPTQAESAHQSLANSYKAIGDKLALVPQAKSTDDFIAAVNAYNASVQIFTGDYVGIANLFVSYGVKFSQGDPGNVFTFTPLTF